MLYNNAQYKNESMDQGSVVEYYKKLKDIISTNDGTRSFIIRTEDCHDQNAPFNQSQETRLRITHNDHMISQITEGFINFNIKLTHTHTHTELHEMMAAPSFHFRSVL